MLGPLVDYEYDVTDGGTISNGNGATGSMPILIAKESEPAFVPVGFEPMVTCVPGWSGPTCEIPPPDEAPSTTQGGTPVVTQPVADIPSTPDVLPWWERIATAIVPGTDKVGSFGPPGGYFGPSVEPSVSAAGNGKTPMMAAGMFGDIPPALRNIMLAGLGLFILSQFMGKK